MIKLSEYSEKFEKDFLTHALYIIDNNVNVVQFVNECKKFIPNTVIAVSLCEEEYLSELILLSYEKLNYLTKNFKPKYKTIVFKNNRSKQIIFEDYYNCFEKVRDFISSSDKRKMSLRMVQELDLTVCPYCNRDYINMRSDTYVGCQLDHFFNRSDYPFLAVSLYNLIPTCGVCNLIKSNKKERIVSPFDKNYKFENIKFECEESTGRIVWNNFKNDNIQNNVKLFCLEEAYKIHEEKEVKELLDKRKVYVNSQIDEILAVINNEQLIYTEEDLKEWIYGKPISEEDYRKSPLGKLKHDILKQLQIYQ